MPETVVINPDTFVQSRLAIEQKHMRERKNKKGSGRLLTAKLRDQGMKMCLWCMAGKHPRCQGNCNCICWELK